MFTWHVFSISYVPSMSWTNLYKINETALVEKRFSPAAHFGLLPSPTPQILSLLFPLMATRVLSWSCLKNTICAGEPFASCWSKKRELRDRSICFLFQQRCVIFRCFMGTHNYECLIIYVGRNNCRFSWWQLCS